MAKVRTKQVVFAGGWNPLVANKIEIEAIMSHKTDSSVIYRITDRILSETTYVDENEQTQTYYSVISEPRKKTQQITIEKYNELYAAADVYIEANYTNLDAFTKDKLRESVALLILVENDFLVDSNGDATTMLVYGLPQGSFEIYP